MSTAGSRKGFFKRGCGGDLHAVCGVRVDGEGHPVIGVTWTGETRVKRWPLSLDAELAAWRSRTLEAACYPYLLVDARYEKVRVGGLQRLAS